MKIRDLLEVENKKSLSALPSAASLNDPDEVDDSDDEAQDNSGDSKALDETTESEPVKKIVKKKIIKEFTVNTPVALSKQAIEQASSSDPKIISIQEKINELDIVIEYLEKIEKAVSSLTFDCKNVIDLQKLETT
jgi:hypothetical protein